MSPTRTVRCRLALAALLLWIAAACPAFAHSAGTISGRVKSAGSTPLAGAFAELSGPALPKSRVAVTDAGGEYLFSEVPAGTYRVTFALAGFTSLAKAEIEVADGDSTFVDVVLRPSLTEEVVVTAGRAFTNLADVPNPEESLIGIADAASQGAVTGARIQARPMLRPSDVLESVPGLVIGHHSGEGKAAQSFLRGFNLDHGTDFATTVAGMPANMPTHAHGQGYTDLNFLIPELVTGVQYRKGPYHAADGDFSTAGAAHIGYADALPRSIARVAGGADGYGRILLAESRDAGSGRLLYGLESTRSDGPWVNPDDLRKFSGVLRYSQGDARDAFSLTAMAYDARWNSTDQVPDRALASGALPRFGAIDPTDGGSSHRYSLSGEWQRRDDRTLTRATGYVVDSRMNLFSNFTYFLDDPENGDQFEQADNRIVAGLEGSRSWQADWFGRYTETTVGVQLRHDDIGTVGLYQTKDRERLSTTRQDAVRQSSEAVYAEAATQWSTRFRSVLGLRGDAFQFRVRSGLEVNSGDASAALASPKVGLVMGPFAKTEFYLNAGSSYHSNDARGTTITIDPATLLPAGRVTPLVRARGAEVGVRTVAVPRLQSTLTLWRLDLDSELVFAGDAGTTEAGRPSRRDGIEWTNFWSPRPWLAFDADVAWSRARFTDDDPAGEHIPGAVETVVGGGVALHGRNKAFGALRVRSFGPRPLIEDDSVRSQPSTLLSGQFGWHLGRSMRATLDVFNLTNAEVGDIDSFYTSRLQGEPLAGVDDIHTHPAVPRSFRAALEFTF